MRDIFATVGKILGLCFAALVIGYTAMLTWMLAQRLIPGNTVLQFMTIALFDIGALTWFIQFVTQAKGTLQWAIAGVGFIVGLGGAVIMAAGELILGQSLVVYDNPEQLGWILITCVIVAAVAHASMIYLFHLADPATKNRIENAQKVSKAIERAYETARGEIDRNVDELTKDLTQSVLYEARNQIAASTAGHIRQGGLLEERTRETIGGRLTIPAQAHDLTQKTGNSTRRISLEVPKDTPPSKIHDLITALRSNGKSPARTYAAEVEAPKNERPGSGLI